MNRKLKNSLTALSASALLLGAAILAGSPATPAPATDTPLAVAEAGKGGSSHSNVDRRGLALPYFSFARGVRRIGG